MFGEKKIPALKCRWSAVAIIAVVISATTPVFADTLQPEAVRQNNAWTSPIGFFQKVISRADGDRCAMYPSCSHYATQAFQRHGLIRGWILTCDRLLRCGHDEVRRSAKVRSKGRQLTLDTLKANTRWWSNP